MTTVEWPSQVTVVMADPCAPARRRVVRLLQPRGSAGAVSAQRVASGRAFFRATAAPARVQRVRLASWRRLEYRAAVDRPRRRRLPFGERAEDGADEQPDRGP